MKNKNTIQRALIIQKLVSDNYKVGRQDRCKLWVFRNIVQREYPMSEPTFWRYLAMKLAKEKKEEDKRQLKLFE